MTEYWEHEATKALRALLAKAHSEEPVNRSLIDFANEWLRCSVCGEYLADFGHGQTHI